MQMSKMALKIKKLYDRKLWTKEMVHNVVGKEYGITEEEYEMITNEKYEQYQCGIRRE